MQFTISPSPQLSFSALEILKKILSPALKDYIVNFVRCQSFIFLPGGNLWNTDLISLANIGSADDTPDAILELGVSL